MAEKRRRGPSHRKAGEPPKARGPQPDTLTLKKFKEALGETLHSWDGTDDHPAKDAALERRRVAVGEGDLLALYTALEWCYLDRYGWPGALAIHDTGGGSSDEIEMPQWLLVAVLKLVWRGAHGDWPKGLGPHSTAVGKYVDRNIDLARAYHVLSAREQGVPWEDVFRVVSEALAEQRDEHLSAAAIEASYSRVAKAFRENRLATYAPQPRFPVPEEWGP